MNTTNYLVAHINTDAFKNSNYMNLDITNFDIKYYLIFLHILTPIFHEKESIKIFIKTQLTNENSKYFNKSEKKFIYESTKLSTLNIILMSLLFDNLGEMILLACQNMTTVIYKDRIFFLIIKYNIFFVEMNMYVKNLNIIKNQKKVFIADCYLPLVINNITSCIIFFFLKKQ